MSPKHPIRLAPGLTLPIEATTETFAILGTKGSGKSTAAKRLVEQLTAAGSQCVVIDPTGAWFGIASSEDGTKAGLPFTIFGGDHGALPLNPASGEIIADLAVDTTTPLVLDLSTMRKAEMRRFVLAFAETVYHRNREPLMLVVDEADLFAAQRMEKGDMRLLGAMEDIARRGRIKGIGLCAVTQRPASIHKDVLSQLSVLVCMRLLGPQDRAAVDAWVAAHGDRDRRDQMMATLAGLKPGEAWVWSPSWLDLFQRAVINMPATYDSMKTPAPGARRTAVNVLAPVDIDVLRAKLAEYVAESEANDPKHLKRRVADLEKQLATRQPATRAPAPVPVEVEVEVEVTPPHVVSRITELGRLVDAGPDITALTEQINDLFAQLSDAVAAAVASIDTTPAPAKRKPVAPVAPPPAPTPATRPRHSYDTGDTDLTKAERTILAVLAQHPNGRTRTQLALLSGYSIKSSSLSNALGALRSAGYVTRSSNPITVTAEGITAAGDITPLPTGDRLYRHWANQLGKAERAVLDAFLGVHPNTLTRSDVAAVTGYSETSSSLSNALGKLRSLELVNGWAASDDFVDAVKGTQ